jgi:uncharacterized protein YigE (DUF2233 family)
MIRFALAFLLAPVAAMASTCRDTTFDGASYTLCEVTLADNLRLFHSGPDGAYGSFTKLNEALAEQGQTLGFAMNAGMYHRDLAPVGLYIEPDGERAPLVTRDGPGNFGLLPNGGRASASSKAAPSRRKTPSAASPPSPVPCW